MKDVLQDAILALLNLPEDKQESAARAILNLVFEEAGTDIE
jgi:hypothetical protein